MDLNLGTTLIAGAYPGALPILTLFGGFMLVALALIVIIIVANWKLYEKAGKPGWAAIIPIYNLYILLEIVKKPTWWLVLFFVPVVSIVITFIVLWELAKAFGKDIGYAIGLFFASFIFIPILAFGEAKYVYGDVQTNNAPFTPPTPPVTPTPTV